MKKIALLVLTMAMALAAMAENKQLSVMFGYSSFYLPSTNQAYIETYLDFNAWTLNFAKEEGQDQYRATVEVAIVVRKNDSVAYVKKYDLKSPAISNPDKNDFTFFDLQRFGLENGIYDLELNFRDKNSNQQPLVYRDKLVVYYSSDKPTISNLQLMASATPTVQENMLSRGGYDMVPYINDFVPQSVNQLNLYFEVYNLNRELGAQGYTIDTYLMKRENGQRLNGFGNTLSRPIAKASDPIYTSIDIARLPSGNYTLVAEVRNMNGESLMKADLNFQRSNPHVEDDAMTSDYVAASFAALITDNEKLNYYIDALYPIASTMEIASGNQIVREGDVAAKQSYLYHFWVARDPLSPGEKWDEYRKRLEYVDEHFSYPKTPGYRTDRGRVYLQYGAPDYVRDEKNFVGALRITGNPKPQSNLEHTNESSMYNDVLDQGLGHIYYLPYQLWRYNNLPGNDANRVFLFWDDMRSGFYKLLNSNAVGEINTPFWERMLSQYQLPEEAEGQGEVGKQFSRGY